MTAIDVVARYIDSIDPEDPEYMRQMRRPAEVKEDVRQMEERSRVSKILKTPAFLEELEEIAIDQLKSGGHNSPSSLLAMQKISDFLYPGQVKPIQNSIIGHEASGAIMPICDVRGIDSVNYSKEEKQLRCKVAACHRLIDLYGWSNGMNNCITARISQANEHFLMMPYGLLYHEVTVSNLLKIDMQGQVLDQGSTGLKVNANAFALHSGIHASRPDVKCIMHLRNATTLAVSVMKQGLLPLCSEAMSLGEISNFSYSGSITSREDRDKLTRGLGPANKVMFLRNFGVIIGGESIDEAFLLATHVMAACEMQLKALPLGLHNIDLPSEKTQKAAFDLSNAVTGTHENDTKKYRKGELEFIVSLRQLDNAGYRTGYVYPEALQQREGKPESLSNEVQLPPTTSSYQYRDDVHERSPSKTGTGKQKKHKKTDWLGTGGKAPSTDDEAAIQEVKQKNEENKQERKKKKVPTATLR